MKTLFVIGLPRSGTSLLYKTLCSHEKISLLYESDIYYTWPYLLSGIKQENWAKKLDFWNGHLTRHRLINKITDSRGSTKIEAMRYLYKLYGEENKVIYVGEKSALYGSYLKGLSSQFPDAKFIILWRELTEVLDSVHRASKNGDKYFSKKGLKHEYLGDLNELHKGVQHLLKNKKAIHQVHYRELVNNKELECQKICDFLDLKFDEKMLSSEGFSDEVIPRGQHHSGVKKSEIDSESDRGRGVSPFWASRISRFECLWGERYQSKFSNGQDNKPNLLERMWCMVLYRLTKVRLYVTAYIYWCAPNRILNLLRR